MPLHERQTAARHNADRNEGRHAQGPPGTEGATVYLLPAESKRLRRLALELDMSLHELLLRGADRILAENGQQPLERYGAAPKAVPSKRKQRTVLQ